MERNVKEEETAASSPYSLLLVFVSDGVAEGLVFRDWLGLLWVEARGFRVLGETQDPTTRLERELPKLTDKEAKAGGGRSRLPVSGFPHTVIPLNLIMDGDSKCAGLFKDLTLERL